MVQVTECECVCECVCLCKGSGGGGSGVSYQGSPKFSSLLSFALGVSGLEDTGGRHEVFNVLTQNLVL